MLRAFHLTHYYSTQPVLRDVALTIPQGESVALLGPNGTGKTTLLNILGGVLSPTFGHVEVNGLRRRGTINEELSIRRQCVFLPDDCWLPPDRPGADWLLAVGRVYGVPDETLFARARSLIDVFNLDEVSQYCLGDCSTGQKKKWALCSALLTDAKILLLDEPFSGGLDPAGILALQRILRHASHTEGRTIVFTTPVPEIVEGTADRLLVIEKGIIAADESVAELSGRSDNGSVTGLLQKMFFGTTLSRLESYFEGVSPPALRTGDHSGRGEFDV
jgi:ABC-type multidrug transport system ATPase subunit